MPAMNSRHLVDRFAAARANGEPLVLVTVYATQGSTYSKAGARMLITAGGENHGLISGGCLESDLALRAAQVLAASEAAVVSYDLRDEADELFGLGVGCKGVIDVLLQPVVAARGYEPLASIAGALMGDAAGGAAIVIDSAEPGLAAGATLVIVGDESHAFGIPEGWRARLGEGARSALQQRGARVALEGEGVRVLYAPLLPIPRVLVLGAGLDAVPLVNVLAELGWRVTIADHRPAYLERPGFARAEQRHVVKPASLGRDLPIASYDAVVVMSHHLPTDRAYLRELAQVDVRYLGLLGPPARRQRLLEELGSAAGALSERLRGPVGLDIGADSAESIALSIAAEIQKVLARAAGSDSRRKA
jgi:xanthine/CO dehydrogenase XdhC/CoxF family maturation factor